MGLGEHPIIGCASGWRWPGSHFCANHHGCAGGSPGGGRIGGGSAGEGGGSAGGGEGGGGDGAATASLPRLTNSTNTFTWSRPTNAVAKPSVSVTTASASATDAMRWSTLTMTSKVNSSWLSTRTREACGRMASTAASIADSERVEVSSCRRLLTRAAY